MFFFYFNFSVVLLNEIILINENKKYEIKNILKNKKK